MTDQSTARVAEARSRPAPPSSVSEQARGFLATEYMPEGSEPLPNADDVDGWLRHVEVSDRAIAERIGDLGLPVETEETQIAGVHTYVLRPSDVPVGRATPVFLDFHGGGLVYGGGDLCRAICTPFALTRGMVTWAIDYRMPPRYPYPAALDDGVAVYRALLDQRAPQDVFVGGASAGGNLAAALMVRLKEEGLPMPAGLVLLTPEVDLTESGDTFSVLLGVDNVLRPLIETNRLYAAGHDLADPHLSPLFADVTGFPPTFLQSGTRDLFLSNTVRMHRKLRAAGVEAELHVWEAMPHGGFGGAPEDIEMVGEVRQFLDRHRRSEAPRRP